MRPIKLWMTAFGPYAEKQEVDFREATDAGLFGIYGPVGSGKSSIFSAISFALFGEGAKEEQAPKSLRSDYAAPTTLTEVSLLFELGGKRYFVRRQPEQTRPKLRGEGETTEAHQAWFFDATGIDIDQVTKDNCGAVLAETKVGLVDAQIREILGYDLDQFRQIVLLPQGKFERFLASDSSDRLKILRGLFDVSLYQRMTLRMKERAAEAQREVEDGMRFRRLRLQEAGLESMDDLASAILEAYADCETKEKEHWDADTALLEADGKRVGGEALAKQFELAEEAKRALAALEARKPEIEIITKRHDSAVRARQLIDRDEAVVKAREAHGRANDALMGAETAVRVANSASEQAKRRFEDLKAESAETDELKRRASELDRFDGLLAGAVDLKEKADQAHSALTEASEAAEAADEEVTRLAGEIEIHRTETGNAQANELLRVQLVSERDSVRNAYERARDHAAACSGVTEAETTVQEARARVEDARGKVRELEAKKSVREAQFLAGQAQLLAAQLEYGSPCPVCGSLEHPSPAQGEAAPAGLEKLWRDAVAEFDRENSALQNLEIARSKAEGILGTRKEALGKLAVPDELPEVLEGRVNELNETIVALGEPKDLAGLTAKLDALKRDVGEAEKTKLAKSRIKGEAERQEAACRRSYEDQIASVPAEYRDQAALEELRGSIRTDIERRETLFEQARNAVTEAENRKTGAHSHLNAAKTRVEECAGEIEAAKEAFELRRKTLGITPEAFDAARPDIEKIAELEAQVTEYREDVVRAESRRIETQKAIETKERPDVAALQAAAAEARAKAGLTSRASAEATTKHKSLVGMRDSLERDFERLRKIEEETAPVRELAAAFDGMNKMRTDLETFAIGAMFDQVLQAANLRLDPMTRGRYRLERDGQSAGGRKRRGLDIQVNDIQTGRARAVSTLSGGETFMAALALALGLSDVVERSHGVIRLDTIFIDEGFGSLDSDGATGTLDHVLDVLQDIVGDRRAVGLISHVSVVQEAVPNGFSVIKGAGGSYIEQRII